MHVLPVRIGNVWLAVDTTHVEQALGQRDWLRLPAAPAGWPGVLPWQGRAVAVLDLALRMGLLPLQPGAQRRRTLIVRAADCLLAVPVDEIHEAQPISEPAVRPLHATRQAFAQSEIVLKDTVMPLLDPVSLVHDALANARLQVAAAPSSRPLP